MFLRPNPFDDEPAPRRKPLFASPAARTASGGDASGAPDGGRRSALRRAALRAVGAALVLAVAASLLSRGCGGCPAADPVLPEEDDGPDLFSPVREAPEKFPHDGKHPGPSESDCSGPTDLDSFSAGRDLVYVDDARCWWESDFDAAEKDVECDHTMHAAMEIPFRRLVNLVAASEGTNSQLRVQEAFRAAGVHAARSLHCEGRALDVTLGRPGARESFRGSEGAAALERLAKLCCQAGFDWVFFENSTGTGPHVHASVRRDAPRLHQAPDGFLHQEKPARKTP